MLLTSAAIPYCGPPPTLALSWSQWNLDPMVIGAVVLGAAFLVLRHRRLTSKSRWAGWVALAAVFVAFVSPLCAISSALFAARTLHHIILMSVIAPLVALMLARPPRIGMGSIMGAVVLQAIVLWFWHAPDLYAAALSNDVIYWVMEITLFAASLLFWVSVRGASAPAAALGLVLTMVQMGMLGALLVFAESAVYAPHILNTAAWGLTPLEDQQVAGLVMWAPAAGVYLITALVLVARWIGPDPVSESRAT